MKHSEHDPIFPQNDLFEFKMITSVYCFFFEDIILIGPMKDVNAAAGEKKMSDLSGKPGIH